MNESHYRRFDWIIYYIDLYDFWKIPNTNDEVFFEVFYGETTALILVMYFATVLRFVASFGYFRLKEMAPAKTYSFPLLD